MADDTTLITTETTELTSVPSTAEPTTTTSQELTTRDDSRETTTPANSSINTPQSGASTGDADQFFGAFEWSNNMLLLFGLNLIISKRDRWDCIIWTTK